MPRMLCKGNGAISHLQTEMGFVEDFHYTTHGSLALDPALVQKISKRHFFQDIKNSFHGVTQMGLKPHQNFFQFFFQQIWLLEELKVFAY